MAGFQVSAIADRIQKLDFEASAWKVYTALCTLAKVRGTANSVLQARIFGQGKPSPNFRKAQTMAKQVFSVAMDKSHHTAVSDMGIDDAVTFVLNRIDLHMTALGVSGRAAYEKVNEYASKADIPAPEAAEPEAETANATGPSTTVDETAVSSPAVDPLPALVAGLSVDDLMRLAALVNAELLARAAAEPEAIAA